MDSSYRPQSPDLSGLPQPDELAGSSRFGHHHSRSRDHLVPAFGPGPFTHQATPTSLPPQYQQSQQFGMVRTRSKNVEDDDDEYLPDAAASKRAQRIPHAHQQSFDQGHAMFDNQHASLTAPIPGVSTQPADPTLGVQLKTSFPVARIKRIMQADEDIGKVAQVTPHVVSRALELFMIKLISASAAQAQGPVAAAGGGGKGPKRIQAQHLKKAVASDETFDFLQEIIAKVPDAPAKAKKEGSDSEEGTSGGKGPKKRLKKRKDSGDDF